MKDGIASSSATSLHIVNVEHPNPAYYKVVVSDGLWGMGEKNKTLVLSQSFDEGWIALTRSKSFPFLKTVGRHVLVNNWSNGWSDMPHDASVIYLFFWPQALQWIGFLLLPLPFLWILRRNK